MVVPRGGGVQHVVGHSVVRQGLPRRYDQGSQSHGLQLCGTVPHAVGCEILRGRVGSDERHPPDVDATFTVEGGSEIAKYGIGLRGICNLSVHASLARDPQYVGVSRTREDFIKWLLHT